MSDRLPNDESQLVIDFEALRPDLEKMNDAVNPIVIEFARKSRLHGFYAIKALAQLSQMIALVVTDGDKSKAIELTSFAVNSTNEHAVNIFTEAAIKTKKDNNKNE